MVPLARLVDHLGARAFGERGQRGHHQVVQRLRPQAPAHDEQAQRTRAAGVALGRCGHARDLLAHRRAQPLDAARPRDAVADRVPGARLERAFHSRHHAVGHERQRAVGEPGRRPRLVHDEGLAPEDGHHAARERDVAAHRQDDVRPHAEENRGRLPEGHQELHRQQDPREPALAAHARHRHGLHRVAGLARRGLRSMPAGVPIHTTFQPRAASSFAIARPGKM